MYWMDALDEADERGRKKVAEQEDGASRQEEAILQL